MSGRYTYFPSIKRQRYAPLVLAAVFAAASLTSGAESFAPGTGARIQPTTGSRQSMFMFSSKEDSTTTSDQKIETELEEKKDDAIKAKTWNPLRLAVMKVGMTELPMTSKFNYGKYDGDFTCGYCGQVLFDSNSKYDSGSGWPSFWRSANDNAIQYKRELDGRLECSCKRCDSHLGHVFLDGPKPASVPQDILQASPPSDPRGRSDTYLPRFCVNGASLDFKPRNENDKK